MISLTEKERETLLILFKDFTGYYNANSISKVLRISHVGAQKIFKRLQKENLIIGRQIGKSIIYKLNMGDDYACRLIAFLLLDEANSKFKRWLEEFRELFKKDRMVILFGSTLKNYAAANDIDVMIVIDKKDYKEVKNVLDKKRQILPKKIHSIELTEEDLKKNIKKMHEPIVDAIKNGIVLCGHEKYVEVIKNAASF
mgnify:CR=1 FL=1